MTYAPYAPRKCSFLGWFAASGWRLKLYAIAAEGKRVDPERFGADGDAPPMTSLIDALPPPDFDKGTPGVGFAILHEGTSARYLVGGWWINQNELASRVWVDLGDGAGWIQAHELFSFCVWDLEVIWHERNAYVATFMHGGTDPDGYLGRTFA